MHGTITGKIMNYYYYYYYHFTAPVQDYPDKPVPEEIFWVLGCKGR